MCGITGFAERNHKAETARRIVKGMADLIPTAARTAKATMWTTR